MSFAVTLYRLYFAPKALVNRMVGRSPRAQRGLNRAKGLVRRYLLPRTREWLQVQTGLSQGMWMRLTLPDEARYWRGEHDLDVQRVLDAAVPEGSVVYDVGAHLGFFALGAARLAGQSGHVVAFDGDPDNVVRLRENALYNHLEGRLEVVHAAVWSSSASAGIPFRRGIEPRAQGGVESNGHRPILGSADLITVPVITLDEFIARGGLLPDVIKIDVEGGEAEVLRGGTRLFATKRPIIVAEVHQEPVAEKIRPWLVEKRYRENWNLPEGTYPRQLFAWPEEFDGAAWMQRCVRHVAQRKF